MSLEQVRRRAPWWQLPDVRPWLTVGGSVVVMLAAVDLWMGQGGVPLNLVLVGVGLVPLGLGLVAQRREDLQVARPDRRLGRLVLGVVLGIIVGALVGVARGAFVV